MSRLLPLALSGAFAMIVLPTVAPAQPPAANYDESKVPKYELPDPLTLADGTKVTDAKTWVEKRRPEILELFRTHVYGRVPTSPVKATFEVTSVDKDALGGLAVRKEVTIHLERDGRRYDIPLLMYLPNDADGPVPVFLGANFRGNHAISTDPGITIHGDSKEPRGAAASRWPVEMILKRGYGLATVHRDAIDPDRHDGFKNGVHSLFEDGGEDRPADAWGTIAGWAWGLSRALDYLQTDADVDAKRVAVIGHSRLGKTALWAGAEDPRFALVISNDSGCGGAALSRRAFGETVQRINTSFPHWFCRNFRQYNGNEAALPVDQHTLIALIAPRPVYVASAEDDRWADPKGEFLSAKHASPVYELLGKEGLPADEQPPVNHPSVGTIGYHIRTGKHDVTDYDWKQYLDFADRHLRAKK